MEDLPKHYDPKQTEEKWSQFWEKEGFFVADASSEKPPYCIVMPPPNVTGVLHMGHALVSVLQDILIRWKRMCGFEALWVPGTDHAGIATQTVVERHLIATKGKRRTDYSRDEFLKIVWQWKEEREGVILSQLKSLGCSCDWTRLRFSMDEGCDLAVRTAFKKLFDQGLIYQGDYLVNWDPVTQTALADDEVEYEERESFLWHFRYPLADGSEDAIIATTRPETMLGDTAVAVNPKDRRYHHLIGQKINHPITGRQILIIGDHHIKPEFGTGMVKITPAHDPNDYRMGMEHSLPLINVLSPDGHMNENALEFSGMTREEARECVVAKLKDLGLLVKVEPYTHRVGVSYRSKAVIEPYLSKQWFIRMGEFAKKLSSAAKEKRIQFLPPNWEHTYFHWVDHLRDWCISRQLWWGHRIPIFTHKEDPSKQICYIGEGLPPEVEREPDLWQQEEDVLDTWFSSALWPLSTLGWPHETPDLKKFYPTSVLVTGHDILFFWVARMLVMGEHFGESLPFPETFLHGLIYGKSYWREQEGGQIAYVSPEEKKQYDLGKPIPKDVHEKWEKLSKSKGNVIDPLELIDTYGTDALRLALCSIANQSPQIDLDRRKFEEFGHFANKVWNGARFVLMNLSDLSPERLSKGLDRSKLTIDDKWILARLNRVNQEVNASLSHYQFDETARLAYDFFWKEFCAYYVEITKPVLFGKEGTKEQREQKQILLLIVLNNALRLLHPIAPFITEELFMRLKEMFGQTQVGSVDPYTKELVDSLHAPSISVAKYPDLVSADDLDPLIEEQFQFLMEIIYALRNIRGEMRLPPKVAADLVIESPLKHHVGIKSHLFIIRALIQLGDVTLVEQADSLPFSAVGNVGETKLHLLLPQELIEQEKKRLAKEQEKLEKQKVRLQKQLDNQDFLLRASSLVIEKQRQSLQETEQKLDVIQKRLAG